MCQAPATKLLAVFKLRERWSHPSDIQVSLKIRGCTKRSCVNFQTCVHNQ